MPSDTQCATCGFWKGHAEWCALSRANLAPEVGGQTEIRDPFEVRGASGLSAGARRVAENLRRVRSIELLTRELQGAIFTEEEGKTLIAAIAQKTEPEDWQKAKAEVWNRDQVPATCHICGWNLPQHAKTCPVAQKAENFERDVLQNGREHPRGSIQSIFSYRAPRPDQLPRFQSIREAFMLTAEIILNNVPPCADRMQAIDELSRVMMLVNRAIALDGEELQV